MPDDWPSLRLTSGFSLLELMVVLAVMSLLTGLGTSATIAIRNWMAHQESRTLFLEIATACRLYRMEHGDWPPGLAEDPTDLSIGSDLLRQSLQPYTERDIKDEKLADGFGNSRIFIAVDTDGDQRVKLSGDSGEIPNAPPQGVSGKVIVFSRGEDGSIAARSWDE